jgi:hypothetical protein
MIRPHSDGRGPPSQEPADGGLRRGHRLTEVAPAPANDHCPETDAAAEATGVMCRSNPPNAIGTNTNTAL